MSFWGRERKSFGSGYFPSSQLSSLHLGLVAIVNICWSEKLVQSISCPYPPLLNVNCSLFPRHRAFIMTAAFHRNAALSVPRGHKALGKPLQGWTYPVTLQNCCPKCFKNSSNYLSRIVTLHAFLWILNINCILSLVAIEEISPGSFVSLTCSAYKIESWRFFNSSQN